MAGIAFLGTGRIASAMVEGLLSRGAALPSDLICLGGRGASAAALSARTGIGLARTTGELLAGADTLVVAFKPQQLGSADPALAGLTAGRLVISVLAGRRIVRLAAAFPAARNIVRCMPNTPARIGAGITGWCSRSALSAGDRATVESLLGALGRSVEVPEDRMDALTGLSGSGPAYVFEFAAALRDGGVAAGLDAETAGTLAIETLLGASRLLAGGTLSPEALRDQVVSPNGTTHAALQRLASGGFRDLVREAVLAARNRSVELSAE
jgi:pyrroline-5-carboxylate reductase